MTDELAIDELATIDWDEELISDDLPADELSRDDLTVEELATEALLSGPVGGSLESPPPQPLINDEQKIIAGAKNLQ